MNIFRMGSVVKRARSRTFVAFAGAIGVIGLAGLATYLIVGNSVQNSTAEADRSDEQPLDLSEVTPPVGPNEEYTPAGIPTGGVGQANPPGPDVTPEPGATPDTTQSWWYVPYLNAERGQPATVQTISGITVGPGRLGVREDQREECASEIWAGTYDEVSDPQMAINLDALPAGSEVVSSGSEWAATFCDERTLSVGVEVSVPQSKDVILGGNVIITKYRGAPVSTLDIPDRRRRAGEINSYPAVIARPILDDIGLGQGAVIVYYEGILLRVQTSDIPMNMMLDIAEAQVQ